MTGNNSATQRLLALTAGQTYRYARAVAGSYYRL